MLPRKSEVFEWCREGNLELLQGALSRQEISPFVIDEYGRGLLHHTAAWAYFTLMPLLVQLGVDPDHEDIWGRKALHLFNATGRPTPDHVEACTFIAEAQEEVGLQDLNSYSFRKEHLRASRHARVINYVP